MSDHKSEVIYETSQRRDSAVSCCNEEKLLDGNTIGLFERSAQIYVWFYSLLFVLSKNTEIKSTINFRISGPVLEALALDIWI